MIETIAELVRAAGPAAGWAVVLVMLAFGLWLYSSDRLVSRGRHKDQASHYEELLSRQEQHHKQTLEELRSNFEKLLRRTEDRAESYRHDRDYWREIALDLMGTVAASLRGQGSQDESSP